MSNPYYNHPPARFPGHWYGNTMQPSMTYNDALGSVEGDLVKDGSPLKMLIVAASAYHGYKRYGKMGGIGYGVGALLAPLLTAGLVGYQTLADGGFGKKESGELKENPEYVHFNDLGNESFRSETTDRPRSELITVRRRGTAHRRAKKRGTGRMQRLHATLRRKK